MRNLVALAAMTAFIGGAQLAAAADLSYKDSPYDVPPAPIWGGFYIGGHVGGLWNDGGDTSGKQKYCQYDRCQGLSWVTKNLKFDEGEDDATLIGGVHVGYNIQDGARVYGVEADVSFGDGIDYLASLRARLGYANDSYLIYATAGVAFAGFEDTAFDTGTAGAHWGDHSAEFSGESKVGLVVGAGAEYKIRPNLSIGVEGLYYFFGDSDESDSYKNAKWCKEWNVTHEDDNDLFVVRARMSYHLQDAYDEPLK